MRRKICTIGNSCGVSLPVEALEKLKLAVGSEVEILVDEELRWEEVRPVLARHFDGRFNVISPG